MTATAQKRPRLSLSAKIFFGLGLGIVAGVFFGGRQLPNATIVPMYSIQEFMEGKRDNLDAFAGSAEGAAAWSLLYPQFSVVPLQPNVIKIPVVYPLPRGAHKMREAVNAWIHLKQKDGTVTRLYNYWILGKSTEQKGRRWSVIRNVLHWLD